VNLRELLAAQPLIVSVQASEGAAVDHPETLARMAVTSAAQGVRLLRAQGIENIRAIRAATGLPVIGLIKRNYEGSAVYITPTAAEVQALLDEGCEIIALDGTARPRPGGATLPELVAMIHRAGRFAMADCDRLDSMQYVLESGADLVGTTLAGYTDESVTTVGPDFGLLRQALSLTPNVIAEGRFSRPEEAQLARRIGAMGVVIGGAINDPLKQTRVFSSAVAPAKGPVGAVDIGGTWLRFGLFSPDWELLQSARIELPATPEDREIWIKSKLQEFAPVALGVSTGGVVNPAGIVTEAKSIIPDHVGSCFDAATFGIPTVALNDGLATAWAHACHPEFAGKRVATLALGTGVGCGMVAGHRIFTRGGDYARLNDLEVSPGVTYEELLGGAALSPNPSAEQKELALRAARHALSLVRALWMPEVVVLAGGVGLSPWLLPALGEGVPSPFGPDAGLFGAAALALFPPVLA
jgi:N-acetylmannosamine-6-phosphate 2-epimerase / N-acetylmannosamine kinase